MFRSSVLIISFLVIYTSLAVAADDQVLSPVEARKKVGDKITVEMTVQAAKDRLERRGEIYLDSEADFHDEKDFAVVITKAGATSLKEVGIDNPAAHFKDKKIRATGTVKEVDKIPRIEIDDAKQITIVNDAVHADWPQRLGPRRDGSTTQKVAAWKEDDKPKVLWHKAVGNGYSAPVVAGGRVYVHAHVKDKEAEEVIAFDATSGEELWRTSYERPPMS
jgi:hypothetical protein